MSDVAAAAITRSGEALPPELQPAVALVERTLDDGKAEAIVTINLIGKSSFADCMVIASGRSARQVAALADQVITAAKAAGLGVLSVEGKMHGDWVLIDLGDIVVHLFRPEVRLYYNLEKMWLAPAITGDIAESR